MRKQKYSHNEIEGYLLVIEEATWLYHALEYLSSLMFKICDKFIPNIPAPKWLSRLVFGDDPLDDYSTWTYKDNWCYAMCHGVGNRILNTELYKSMDSRAKRSTIVLTSEQVNYLLVMDTEFADFHKVVEAYNNDD